MKADVVIVGGGLMGCTTAFWLAKRGVSVIVFDKEHPGRHASGVNAGGLRKLFREPAEIPLALSATDYWKRISEFVDSDCDVKLSGQIRVAENASDLELIEQRLATMHDLGYSHEVILDRDRLFEKVPGLSPHCVGALYCEDDGFARPFHATTAFRRKAESLGAVFHSSTHVERLETQGDGWILKTSAGECQASVIVNASGAWAGDLAKQIGDRLPIKPKAPTLMVTERLGHFIDPVLSSVAKRLSFKQMQNGTLIIGGAHLANLEMDSETTQIDYATMAKSADTVLSLFPQLKSVRIVRFWAGIEAYTPDNLPIICSSKNTNNAFHVAGFSAHGFQLSPVIGKLVTEEILDGKASIDLSAFSLDRFE